MEAVYTEKQAELIRMWQRDELKRINLLEGSRPFGKDLDFPRLMGVLGRDDAKGRQLSHGGQDPYLPAPECA